mgnify:FL=1|jgi:hypothetical protein
MKMEELSSKNIYVPTDEMRTNKLSLTPGGSVIRVLKSSHEVVYDKIKYPEMYINKLINNSTDIVKIFVDDKLVWEKK